MTSVSLHFLANPARFVRWGSAILPWAWGVAALCFAAGLYCGLVVAPADYQQGDSVRILYIHVPSAIMAEGVYVLLALCGIASLVWRHLLADAIGRAAAPLGAGFAGLTLVSGSFWGYPTWGTYWVWDARLTSALVLFLLYLGYIVLSHSFDRPEKGSRFAAILAVIGTINLPIIKFSVEWWSTLHQPASIGFGGIDIDWRFLVPLVLMAVGFLSYFVAVLILRVKADLLRAKIRHLEAM